MSNGNKAQKKREKKIKKLMKDAHWEREEAERWLNYIESVDDETVDRKINY